MWSREVGWRSLISCPTIWNAKGGTLESLASCIMDQDCEHNRWITTAVPSNWQPLSVGWLEEITTPKAFFSSLCCRLLWPRWCLQFWKISKRISQDPSGKEYETWAFQSQIQAFLCNNCSLTGQVRVSQVLVLSIVLMMSLSRYFLWFQVQDTATTDSAIESVSHCPRGAGRYTYMGTNVYTCTQDHIKQAIIFDP